MPISRYPAFRLVGTVTNKTPTILSVHAHPDDESSKGAPTIARYRTLQARCVLVTATGGEEGDILNPKMDRPEIRGNLAEIRNAELEEATKIIGYDEVIKLGYRDSGMPGTEANERLDAFYNIPIDVSTDRLVEIFREQQPHVVITYPEDQSGYPHPDHLRVHDISLKAFDLAGNSNYKPELGEPFQPLKLYYSLWTKAKILAIVERFESLGLESPFPRDRLERQGQDDLVTTQIDVADFLEIQRRALLAHRTQIDPNSPFWFGLPTQEQAKAYSTEDYHLARSTVEVVSISNGEIETDLFEGTGLSLAQRFK